MHAPHRVAGTKLFMETCFSADATLKKAEKLLEHFSYPRSGLELEFSQQEGK